MIIEFEKIVTFHAEVDEKQFESETNEISMNKIIEYCENTDSPIDEECWVYSSNLNHISWKKSEKDDFNLISESDYENFVNERERIEHCYECGGYGDDYDYEGNGNCEKCPWNSTNIDYDKNTTQVTKTINSKTLISNICNKIVEYYKNMTKEEDPMELFKDLMNSTKFKFLEIDKNNRIFLFAENPQMIIKDITLWNYLQCWIHNEYNTFIAIGLYEPNSEFSDETEIVSIHDLADYFNNSDTK